MKVRIKFFSVFRDATGFPEIEITIEKALSVKQLINILSEYFPKLKKIFEEIQPTIIVDGEVVSDNILIERDAEIAIAPPASGGNNIKVSFFTDDISIDKIVEEIVLDSIGAVAMFVGIVKGDVEGHRVYELVYDVYEPYAKKVLEKIAREEAEKHQLYSVQIHHKVGVAKPGQKTVVIAVSAKGRSEALEALRSILERVKHEPPIYKLEKRDDGEYWVIGDGTRIPRFRSE